MFIRLLYLSVLVVISTSVVRAADNIELPAWLEAHSQQIQQQAIDKNIPGYVFAYIEKGQVAKVFVYGKESKHGDAITADTVFRLASVSKTFTAMLMAKYVEQHRVQWQQPIAQLVPNYAFSAVGENVLQLQHIVGQSSGFTPNAYDNLIEANYPLPRVLNMLSELKPLCAPGKCYTYQNTLFGVLEEYFKQHHSTFGQAIDQTLFKPLQMPHASVGKNSLLASENWAKPHVAIGKKTWRAVSVRDDYYQYSPAAGVNASMRDMVLWVRALLGEFPQVMNQQLIDTVTEPLTESKKETYRREWRQYLNDAHYGLGWRIYDFNGHKLNYHGGWVQGYRADVAFTPDYDVGYVMLMNAESNLINQFSADFWAACFAALELQSKQIQGSLAAAK
ncbi:serine hydrolase domain-containing protein [Flavobacterium sp. W21_SRS_FM6]|uniref:serine hydrolase domain-containing protein n=1 Tax=Flavobacterium sp. W21_SRS_FM6 TaxID=3240268 RepID=UPI003F918915